MGELAGAALILVFMWATYGLGGVLLAALVLFVAWAVSRLMWPYKPCSKCGGTGRNRGSNGRRHGDCRRCKHTGRVRRFGAAHVHRVKLAILGRKK